MIAAKQLLAITLIRQRETCVGIQFQYKDPSGIGAVHHPQLAVFVKKHIRVHHIRLLGGIINLSVIADASHAGFENNPLVLIWPFNLIGNSNAHRRQRGISPAGVIIHIEISVRELNDIRSPQGIRLGPAKGIP
ncbi:hypothetical protein D3C75_864970 [compost metagenome]